MAMTESVSRGDCKNKPIFSDKHIQNDPTRLFFNFTNYKVNKKTHKINYMPKFLQKLREKSKFKEMYVYIGRSLRQRTFLEKKIMPELGRVWIPLLIIEKDANKTEKLGNKESKELTIDVYPISLHFRNPLSISIPYQT